MSRGAPSPESAEIIKAFQAKQRWSYDDKVAYARAIAEAFYNAGQEPGFYYQYLLADERIKEKDLPAGWQSHTYNCHASVGGLDSITLLYFLRSIGIDVPAISVSSLEDRSIQRIHKDIGVIRQSPARKEDGSIWKKAEIIREFGFPVISKETAGKIELLQNPTPDNATVRHAIMTGETGEYGGWQKHSRMKLSGKWLALFGGPENEKHGTNYKTAPFKVSSKCCYYLKEKPCDDWARDHNSNPYLGLMASEGGRRQKSLMLHGCNYYGKSTVRSCPFAIFQRQDLLHLALDLKVPVPEIYGEIKQEDDGTLRTTEAQRTGCSMCGFGIHFEKRPHRFDRLYESNPKEWRFWMHDVGWGEVLDYIGVEWRQEEHSSGQLMWFISAPPTR